jgi:subtilase family serine protease
VPTPLSANVKRACPPPRAGYAACLALERTDINARRSLFARGSSAPGLITPDDTVPPAYGPADLWSAYNLAAASAQSGIGATVALVDAYDDPNAEADLSVYRDYYGLPACTTANGCFMKVNQDGTAGSYPAPDWGWSTEITLDLDMVSAICPNCHILLVEASSANWAELGASVNTAVKMGALYVSNSYGGGENDAETTLDRLYYNHPGVVITAASGDGGYGVEYPAASPYVTAVGGTSLLHASNARGWAEIAWTSGGSGCSGYEPKPSWQVDHGCSLRAVADVSAVADPSTGVSIYDTWAVKAPSWFTPGWNDEGGTSAASPIVAAVYALAGPPEVGTSPPSYAYAHPGDLYDILAGTNDLTGDCTPEYLCNAGPGYDGPTGLGTPDGPDAFAAP